MQFGSGNETGVGSLKAPRQHLTRWSRLCQKTMGNYKTKNSACSHTHKHTDTCVWGTWGMPFKLMNMNFVASFMSYQGRKSAAALDCTQCERERAKEGELKNSAVI